MERFERTLGRIEEKIDNIKEDVSGLEPRVRSLEKSRTYASGIAAACSAVGAFVWGFVK